MSLKSQLVYTKPCLHVRKLQRGAAKFACVNRPLFDPNLELFSDQNGSKPTHWGEGGMLPCSPEMFHYLSILSFSGQNYHIPFPTKFFGPFFENGEEKPSLLM